MNREIKFRAWNKHNKKMYYKVRFENKIKDGIKSGYYHISLND